MTEPERTETSDAGEADPLQGPEALQDVALRAAELSEYLAAFLRAKKDGVALTLRQALKGIILTVLIILGATGALLTGIVFVFYGMAEGLGKAFGGREWLGYLIAGAVPLAVTFLFLKISVVGKGKFKAKKAWKEYESELSAQRARFGHDAAERAADWASR